MVTFTKYLFASMLVFFLSAMNAQAMSVNALFHNNDPTAGNPRGNVTIVEFFDYNCWHCITMAPVIDAIIRSNPNVRVVFKEFPIRGPESDYASRVALIAHKQGKYYRFSHTLLTAHQPLTEALVRKVARDAGINMHSLNKDLQDSNITRQLRNNHQIALALNLTGTPAFFIGKTDEADSRNVQHFLGEMSAQELQRAIAAASQ